MAADPATFRPTGGVHARRVGEELVILDVTSGQYYALDEVGAAMWDELSRGRTIEQTVEALLATYSVAREQLESDVRALVDTLTARGLLERNVSR